MSERFVDAGGVSLFVRDEGDGEPVVLLHGFPDTHAMWRGQVAALADAGYRVIAPDLRGRGASDKPQSADDYFAPLLMQDVTAILDALGVERAHVAGHDWGAAVGWLLASFEPERIASFTAVSVGHPAAWAWPSVEQRRRSWYIPFFCLPAAERALRHDDWRLLREWTGNHSETDAHIAALQPEGALTAGLNWYRANTTGGWFADPLPYPPVEAPVLGVIGDDDPLLTVEQMAASEAFAPDWRMAVIAGGHWITLDATEAFNALLLNFLAEQRGRIVGRLG